MSQPVQRPARPAWAMFTAAAAAVTLASCGTSGSRTRIEPEAFGSTTTHSRPFANPAPYTCEAARRALLSQGFVITAADPEHVKGRKNFQPEAETHVEIEFTTTCAPDGRGGKKSIVFVNALQDRYALKKSNNSASVGVGALGSLSLPFTSSDDAMVKVASETITSAPFYDRFFTLLERYLVADSDLVPEPAAPVIVPMPTKPAAAASAASAAAASTAAASAASSPAAAEAPPPAAPASAASAP